ncbi:putative transposase [Candidatus Nitrososphaera gargensis Ga9.2]|uniref:Putative transposase n=1 Tax=Nitrososphaera gargensis (strain Ga9.2) TaxID=1237085 RepID=K0ICC4_NITGG|nr:putative transposase [Candidatus Nitrososphaera gargensis Ga9.2]
MHYVLRTDVVLLKPPKSQEIELRRLAEQSSLLWNAANYERRQAYFKHHKIPTYHEQCKTLKHSEYFKAIGTGKGQALLKKLQEAWNSFFALKRLQRQGKLPPNIQKVRIPSYWKNRITNRAQNR